MGNKYIPDYDTVISAEYNIIRVRFWQPNLLSKCVTDHQIGVYM